MNLGFFHFLRTRRNDNVVGLEFLQDGEFEGTVIVTERFKSIESKLDNPRRHIACTATFCGAWRHTQYWICDCDTFPVVAAQHGLAQAKVLQGEGYIFLISLGDGVFTRRWSRNRCEKNDLFCTRRVDANTSVTVVFSTALCLASNFSPYSAARRAAWVTGSSHRIGFASAAGWNTCLRTMGSNTS